MSRVHLEARSRDATPVYALPQSRPLTVFSRIPDRFNLPRRSLWFDVNLAGHIGGCFLEGPDFDAAGNLYIVDIPFGRIFRIDPQGVWTLVVEYDGWPNGLKVEASGTLLVTDFKLGLLRINPVTGEISVLVDHIDGQPLLGLNDLTRGPDGTLYFTDQGQTGLHDARGRVLQMGKDCKPGILLTGCPSPNGLVFDQRKPWLYVAMTRGNAVWRVPLYQGAPVKVGIAIQLSGGLGPDGMTLDPEGRLLVAHPHIGIWQFDRQNRPLALYELRGDSMTTNLVVRNRHIYVTDSIAGQVLTAKLIDA